MFLFYFLLWLVQKTRTALLTMRNYESRIGRPRFPALWEFSCFYSKFSLAFQIDCCFFNFWFYDNQSKSVLQWTLNYNRQVRRLKSFYNLPLRKPFFFSNGTSAVYPTPSQKLVFQFIHFFYSFMQSFIHSFILVFATFVWNQNPY